LLPRGMWAVVVFEGETANDRPTRLDTSKKKSSKPPFQGKSIRKKVGLIRHALTVHPEAVTGYTRE